MLKNLRSKLRYKSFVLTVAITSLLNCALATEIARSQVIEKRISIDVEKKTLKEALDQISKQAHIGIIYSNAKGILNSPVTIHAKDQPISRVLTDVLSPLTLTYEIIGDQIVVKFDNISSRPPSQEQTEKQRFPINGKVTDVNGAPLPGATIKVKDRPVLATTDNNGEFQINEVADSTILQVSFIGYLTKEVIVSKVSYLTIILENASNQLNEVAVVSTGYQTVTKERSTGSFTLINNQLLNRTVSPDLLSRLKGVTNGLLFDSSTGNSTGISIRGRSTIFSNTTPLIVVDNFPFEGDLNTINPDVIENVTVLKDAAAASIWGVRAGNGVIVITTKKGRLNQKPQISFKADITIGEKPNLNYQPKLTSSQYIDVEKFLFGQGAYDATIANGYSSISPVVEILQKQKLNQITAAQADQEINALRNIDVRDQQSKYFYRNSKQQHYSADISGGSANQSYYFSMGYDKDIPNSVALSDSRITLKGNNSFSFLNNRLKFNTDITFSKSQSKNDYAGNYTPYVPYEQIADAKGSALATLSYGGLRASYTDTAGNGKLQDWKYRPLDELRNKYSTQNSSLTDYRLNLGLSYKIINPLTISLNYQYYNANNKIENFNDQKGFYARNLINTYSQIDGTTGTTITPIPIGAIFNPVFASNQSNYGRTQIDFNKLLGNKHEISAIAGYEVRDDEYKNNSYTVYGYKPETATNIPVDYLTYFPYYYDPFSTYQIPPLTSQSATTNKYVSWYGNGSYTYDKRYIFSASYRKDESNLFGVKANQKGVPLWSTGLAWNVQNEEFFKINWLSTLQLKASYGYNGNVNNSISAYLTASPSFYNPYGIESYAIVNPPNDNLRWERVKNINTGLYFSTTKNRLSGSIEYYIKNGTDLIATSPIAPQTGVLLFTGNTADTHTNGVDIQLNSKNIEGNFRWGTTIIFDFVKDKITGYKVAAGTNQSVVTAYTGRLSPIVGYPINSVFAYKWAGLDGSGNPQGYLNGAVSTDYTAIRNVNNISELQFFGSATPTIFGSFRNTFSYRNLELSINITYKMGYYFRRQSLNYDALYGGQYTQADYNSRWQKAGDEQITNVPSQIYPLTPNRNDFYSYSAALVEKGDQIRLQDLQINYSISKAAIKSLPFANVNIYLYLNNLGLLWRANKYGLDPDVRSGYPNPRTIALGIKTNF